MKFNIKIFLIVFISILASTFIYSKVSEYIFNDLETQYENKSILLNRYFNFHLKRTIPKNEINYLIINSSENINYYLENLKDIDGLEIPKNTVLILSGRNTNLNLPKIKNVVDIIFDEEYDFAKFNISKERISLIQVSNQKIVNIVNFD